MTLARRGRNRDITLRNIRVPFVALDICDRPGMKATGLFKHPGVAAHPSDQGMAEIARRILNALFPDG